MKPRKSTINRKTKETNISVKINLDGTGKSKIDTKIKFLDHMLELFAKHGLFDLEVNAKGDLKVDQHHTVEDVGITLGHAVKKALGNMLGIERAGYFVMPMDESMAIIALDISGRPYLKFDAEFKSEIVGSLQTELVEDFFKGFVDNLRATLHIKLPYGRTDHHRIEAIFKAFGRSLGIAVSLNPKARFTLPSTKGLI